MGRRAALGKEAAATELPNANVRSATAEDGAGAAPVGVGTAVDAAVEAKGGALVAATRAPTAGARSRGVE